MNDIPSRISLGEVIKLERRPVRVNPERKYQEIGIYCFGKGVFHKEPRTGFEVGDKSLFLIKANDFVFQVTFAWEGAVALMSDSEDGYYASSRFPTYRVDEDKCNPKYLLYYFRTAEGIDQLINISPGSAGRNRVLSLKLIPKITIPLPPLAEQLRIVENLDGLGRRIEEVRKIQVSTELEIDALGDSLLRKILSQHKQDNSWEYGPLSHYAQINPSRKGRLDLEQNTLVSFVPMSVVDDVAGTITKTQIRPYYEVSKGYTWFKNGDVIFARITPCMQNGKSAVANNLENGHGFGSTEFHVLRPGQKILAEWLHIIVRSIDFIRDAEQHFKGTAGQQRVPQSFLESRIVPVPPIDMQKELISAFNSFNSRIAKYRVFAGNIKAETDALMPTILNKAFYH